MPLRTLTCQQPVLPLCLSPWLLLLTWGGGPLDVLRHHSPSAGLQLFLLVLNTARKKSSLILLHPLNTNLSTPPSLMAPGHFLTHCCLVTSRICRTLGQRAPDRHPHSTPNLGAKFYPFLGRKHKQPKNRGTEHAFRAWFISWLKHGLSLPRCTTGHWGVFEPISPIYPLSKPAKFLLRRQRAENEFSLIAPSGLSCSQMCFLDEKPPLKLKFSLLFF